MEDKNMDRVTSYTITIKIGENTLFNKGYVGKEHFEKLIEQALESISNFNESDKIGVLVVAQRMDWNKNLKCYSGSQNLHNVYSHIHSDGDNYVTVNEFKDFLKTLSYKEYAN